MIDVEGLPIRTWGDLLNAPYTLDRAVMSNKIELPMERFGDRELPVVHITVEREQEGQPPLRFSYLAPLGTLPVEELVPSVLWFSLKMMLFLLAGLVFWNRPDDRGAAQFFLLCTVTLGAYMGGYHWAHVVSLPLFLLPFIICALLTPAICLHFYLIFPNEKALFRRFRPWWLLLIYGVPIAFLAAVLLFYFQVRHLVHGHATPEEIAARLRLVSDTCYVYFGVAAVWYLSCVVSLMHSFWTITDATQKSQVRWILYGALLATLPIGYSMYLAIWNTDVFASGGATWPMFAASMCLNTAFAISIARYRLMELDKIMSSGFGYFVISVFAALIYFALVFIGTVVFNQVIASPRLVDAITVATTTLLLMVALDLLRSQFRKMLDRRFSRDKSHLDDIMQQLGQAIEHLVDPQVLAQRLLRTSTDLLGVSRGAVYVSQEDANIHRLAGAIGEPPPLSDLPPGSPIIEALRSGGSVSMRGRDSAAQRQLQFLGGEVAQALTHEGRLLAVLILGAKASPYRPEDLKLLAAFTQVSGLAMHSAEVNRTIESLNNELQTKVDKIAEQQQRIVALQSQLRRQRSVEVREPTPAADNAPEAVPSPGGIVGSSPVTRQLLHVVRQVAATDAVVLIRGESGTGKELIARAVHETSQRAAKPFVKVHCAALSPGLLESELFGHVKGAFTGAHRDKIGRFELANGGTLFLDEIGDIGLDVQTKLLRVLQEKTFERVGSSEPIAVDVRIITATHQNLEKLIEEGRFREDLFYRLNVFPIQVSPLRERPEDIPELAAYFVALSGKRCRKEVMSIDDDVLVILKAYSWPGNIRQLENVIERAVVIAEGPLLTVSELPSELLDAVSLTHLPRSNGVVRPHRRISRTRAELEQQEREMLVDALASADGNKAEAARALGLARSTLVSKLRKYGLL